jgi:hypothetical protein
MRSGMKVVAVGLLVAASYVASGRLRAERVGAIAATDPISIEGTLRDGQPGQTPFQVHAPANWNGTLVVDLDFVTGWRPEQRAWFLAHGYAIGGTRRTQNESAYQIRDYVENFMTIRARLAERADRISARTIAYGVSRGGIPTRAAVEIHPDVFTAAVGFSGGGLGIVGVLLPKLDVVWTLKTLVDPSSPFPVVNVPRPAEGSPADKAFTDLLALAKSTPAGRARLTLAAAFDQQPTWSIARSPKPAARDYDAQAQHLIASVGSFQSVRWQIETAAGGNPSWNNGVDYKRALERSGLIDLVRDQYRKAGLNLDVDLKTLADAPRISADPAAVAAAEKNVTYSGRIKGPFLNVKTVGDPADPPAFDSAYTQTLERAGTRSLLRNVYIERPGHATMSVLERIAAFQMLIDRLDSGRWPDEKQMPAALNALAAAIARDWKGDALGDSLFTLYTPPPSLRSWDFTNWGMYRRP